MEKKTVNLVFLAFVFCLMKSLPVLALDEENIEHSCEIKDERSYCVDASGAPLNGKIYTTWPESEQYKTIINYKRGYADGLATYFNNEGKLIERVYYKTGIKNGMDKIYYANRTIKIWANYKNGKLDGWQNYFTPEGKLQGKMYYKKGKLTNGFCIAYSDKGKLKKTLSTEQIAQNEENKLFLCSESGAEE